MLFKTRRFTMTALFAVMILTLLIPPGPAAGNPASFTFDLVKRNTCLPGDYPEFQFSYEATATETVYHVWTLTNTTNGNSTGPVQIGDSETLPPGQPFTNKSRTIDGHAAFTPYPAGTKPGDTLVQQVQVVDSRIPIWVLYTATITLRCPAQPTPVIAAPVPGCDQWIAIPDTAVVGQFTQDAVAYWSPGLKTESPQVVFEAGKTAWVLGQDETQQFYKIVWQCQYLWVPVDTMGPNPDKVWENTPLPEDIVGNSAAYTY